MHYEKFTNLLLIVALAILGPIFYTQSCVAGEVPKGQIPEEHLSTSCKALPWGVKVWDIDEAATSLKAKENVVWVDTRPASFFIKGTVRNAVLLPYNQTGKDGNELTKEKLNQLISSQELDPSTARIAFFCQGPKCHRSYNAAYVAATQWGYTPENIIWFRAGYPELFKSVKSEAKLRRRAKTYLSDEGIGHL